MDYKATDGFDGSDEWFCYLWECSQSSARRREDYPGPTRRTKSINIFYLIQDKQSQKMEYEQLEINSDLERSIALKQGKSTYDRSEEGRELLEIWAWMLDTYMEIQVSDWKEVMKDKDRTENRTWFRGRSLNKKKVNKIIHGALMEQGISLRKIHDHVTAALDCITNQWRIQEPFKRGEIKAAYYSLFGLASVTIITAVKATDSDIEIEDLTDSPQKTAAFLYERYSSTARFPKDRLERCLNLRSFERG